MATKAEDLTQAGFKKLRSRVARVVAGGIYEPESEHYLMAERLIDAGIIDVDATISPAELDNGQA